MAMYKKLLRNKTFVGNAVIFTIMWGTYTAIGNLLSPLFNQYYTSSQISLIGGVFVIAGVIGCFVAGVVIDKTQGMLGVIRTIATVVTVLITALTYVIPTGYFILTLSLCSVMGFFIVPSITACYTFTVHLTYPIPPAASNGLIMTCAHIYAIFWSILGPKTLRYNFYLGTGSLSFLCLIATIISYVIFNPNQNGSMKKNEQDPEILISVLDGNRDPEPRFFKPSKGVDIAKRTDSLQQHDLTDTGTTNTPMDISRD